MAKKKQIKEKAIEEALWESANKLRGSVEPSEYKHVVLSLIFLKYANDRFTERRNELVADGKEAFADNPETLSRQIRLNEQMIQKLEATAQALYRKMFVDGIDKENLPDGWRMGSFTEVMDICGGGTPSTEEIEYWKEGKIPFYSPGDKTTFYYSLKTEKRITEKGLAHCSSKLYPKNTTFVTARGATTGGLTLSGCPMAMNQTCYAFVDKEKQNPFYVHQLALDTMASLKNEAVGATFEALVTKDFENTEIIIVPKELRNVFNKEATIIYNNILLKQQENLKLAELQSLLLAKMGQFVETPHCDVSTEQYKA